MSKQKKNITDERDIQNMDKAGFWTIFIVIIYIFGKLIYYSKFSNVENLDFLLWDIVLFFVIGISLITIVYLKKTYDLPKTFLGKNLLTEQSKAARKERILKAYLPEALRLSVIMTVGGFLLSGDKGIGRNIFDLIIYFIIFNLLNFAWGELNVKGYNQSLKE